MSYHRTVIMGFVGRDPEVRYTPGGEAICNFSVAVTERYKDQDMTTWYRVVSFGKKAEAAGQHIKKGSAVLVEGRMSSRKWKDNSQQEQTTWELRCDEWRFAGGKNAQASEPSSPAHSAPGATGNGFDDFDDNIPF
jgi:single-strand DNA-binding protein